MKTRSLAWLMAIAAPAAIADVWVNPGFYSYHFQRDKGFNNANTGLGVEATVTETYSVTAGVFHNSDRETSRYLGVYAMPWHVGSLKAGAAIGAFDGYPKVRDGGWFPAIIPTVSWEGSQLGLNMSFIPTVGDRLHGAVTFQLKYKLIP